MFPHDLRRAVRRHIWDVRRDSYVMQKCAVVWGIGHPGVTTHDSCSEGKTRSGSGVSLTLPAPHPKLTVLADNDSDAVAPSQKTPKSPTRIHEDPL